MLTRRVHAWSHKQKWLIVSSIMLALISICALIYGYERYYRGPGEEVFYGTWRDTLPAMDSITYYRFKPDATVDLIIDGMGSIDIMAVGKWYAGGRNLYVRFPPPQDESTVMRPYVWHIVDISPEKIVLRETQHGAPTVWVRVHDPLPTASNQSVELTPTRHALTLQMTKTLSPRNTLATCGGSSLSR